MQRTPTTSARPAARRVVFMALLGALLLLALAQAVPALGAAADYTGGPQAGDYPLYVANDHTVYALRFSAAAGTLLDSAGAAVTAPGAQYYVKLRISPTAKPSRRHEQGLHLERDHPAVGAGARRLERLPRGHHGHRRSDHRRQHLVVLQVRRRHQAGRDRRGDLVPDRLPQAHRRRGPDDAEQRDSAGGHHHRHDRRADPGALTSAFRIHNGVATGATDARRIEATNSGGTDVWSLSRTENNQVAQGYGSDATGDFELGVPVGLAFDAKIQSVIWPALATSFTGSLADVDIALGAADTTPPIAPSALTATAGDGHVQLSWPAVADAADVHRLQVAGGDAHRRVHELHAAARGGGHRRRRRPTTRPA